MSARLGPLGTASLAGLVALAALAGDLFTAGVLALCLAGYVIAHRLVARYGRQTCLSLRCAPWAPHVACPEHVRNA